MKEKIKDIIVYSSKNIRSVLKAIDRGGLGVALIVDPTTDKFLGMVTDGDLRRALLKGYGLESSVKLIEHPVTKTASFGMDMDKISAMFNEFIRVIPLIDNEGRVVDLAIFDSRSYLPVAEPKFSDAELRYVSECVLSGWVSSNGKYVGKFEDQFSEYCQTEYAICSSSGTAALHLALASLGIGPGDEVIVPSLTFISTANAVVYTGAKPVFVDSEQETWNLNPKLIESVLSKNTKAIIPVHLYGHPANMTPILEIAKKYGLFVVEDAAEAHGALFKNQKVGSLGDVGIFSFFGNKTITTGEGGMLVTNNKKLAEKIRILRDHGMDPKRRYWHQVLGFNYRMTNIQAALGVGQMERIEFIIDSKRKNAALYNKRLQNIRGLTTPPEALWAKNTYWMYSILIDKDLFGQSAEELRNCLRKKRIETRPFFPPVPKQPIYDSHGCFPVAERLSLSGINLPSSCNLSENHIMRITEAIKESSSQI